MGSGSLLEQIVQYFQTNSNQYWQYVGQYIILTVVTLVISITIALPLEHIGPRIKPVAQFCVMFAQLLRIIPSLALLFLLIPSIGTGVVPVLVALIVLALPPLLINIILSLNKVSPLYKEAGIALGMDQRRLRRQTETPLALPYISNGMKLALVGIIASATLATYTGAGGLGTLIFTGLGSYGMSHVVIGAVSAAILSLLAMISFGFLIRKVQKYDGTNYLI